MILLIFLSSIVYMMVVVGAVPLTAFLLQAWFLEGNWQRFNLQLYLCACALVAALEVFGIVLLTGESWPILFVGPFSTAGAIVVGAAWGTSSRMRLDEARNG